MIRINLITLVLLLFIGASCHSKLAAPDYTADTTQQGNYEKFEPADGKVLVFAGQELQAIGGLPAYHDGYFDHFPPAAGFTMYTNFLPGTNSYGHTMKGLDGLTTTDNWGDGPSNMSLQVASPTFRNSCLAIGLAISAGNDVTTAEGGRDDLIIRLGKWLKGLGNRPVFLRIGYEFDGYDWNHYKPASYIAAFRRIRHMLDSMGVRNVAYVWQSRGAGATLDDFNAFYPGDDYVDWCGYSFFTPAEAHHPMIAFARKHHKPLMIAEATPVLPEAGGKIRPLDLSSAADAEVAWQQWFVPFFKTITSNPDVIKAFSYICSDWKSRIMWITVPYYQNLDARLWLDPTLESRWKNEISKPAFLNASDTLFRYLWHK